MGLVRFVAGVGFGIVGLLYAAAGLYPLLTAHNYPGVLGRSFTEAGRRRLAKAPGRYWRDWGAWIVATGLFWSSFGLFQIAKSWLTLVVAVTLLLASATALVDLFRTASQHGLLRWQSDRSPH